MILASSEAPAPGAVYPFLAPAIYPGLPMDLLNIMAVAVEFLVAIGTILLALFTWKSVRQARRDRALTTQALDASNRIAESTQAQVDAITALVEATRKHAAVSRDAINVGVTQADRSYRESLKSRVDAQGPILIVELADDPSVRFTGTFDGDPNRLFDWVEHSREPQWRCRMQVKIGFRNFGASPALVSLPSGPFGTDYTGEGLPAHRFFTLKPGEARTIDWEHSFTNLAVEGYLESGGWVRSSSGWSIVFQFTSGDPYGSVFDTHTLRIDGSPFMQDGSRFRLVADSLATTGVAQTHREYPKLASRTENSADATE